MVVNVDSIYKIGGMLVQVVSVEKSGDFIMCIAGIPPLLGFFGKVVDSYYGGSSGRLFILYSIMFWVTSAGLGSMQMIVT